MSPIRACIYLAVILGGIYQIVSNPHNTQLMILGAIMILWALIESNSHSKVK